MSLFDEVFRYWQEMLLTRNFKKKNVLREWPSTRSNALKLWLIRNYNIMCWQNLPVSLFWYLSLSLWTCLCLGLHVRMVHVFLCTCMYACVFVVADVYACVYGVQRREKDRKKRRREQRERDRKDERKRRKKEGEAMFWWTLWWICWWTFWCILFWWAFVRLVS